MDRSLQQKKNESVQNQLLIPHILTGKRNLHSSIFHSFPIELLHAHSTVVIYRSELAFCTAISPFLISPNNLVIQRNPI